MHTAHTAQQLAIFAALASYEASTDEPYEVDVEAILASDRRYEDCAGDEETKILISLEGWSGDCREMV